MSVKLNTRQVGDVTVIDVSGRITLGEGSSALRDALLAIINFGVVRNRMHGGGASQCPNWGHHYDERGAGQWHGRLRDVVF